MTAADLALDWWRAYGEVKLDELWAISSRPVRYMLARSFTANEMNALAANGDHDAANNLLIVCQGFALHGTRGPAWHQLEALLPQVRAPIDMERLINSMRVFPRVEDAIDNYVRVTFYPPDTPPMPWIVDLANGTVVGFAMPLRGSDDAGALGERVALDPIALWS